jgi:ribosomal-protein-alanine N-acetyltransferase
VVTVAEMDGVVVGYSVAIFVGEDGELANLAVAPAVQGKGVGTALLREVISTAEGHGVRNLYLEVRQSNRQALSLYRSAGFTDMGQRRGYYSKPVENAVVMVKHFVR